MCYLNNKITFISRLPFYLFIENLQQKFHWGSYWAMGYIAQEVIWQRNI
jgi:hypothetical protein